MISLVEAMESGAAGLSVALISTYLYSRRKGAERLDAKLADDLTKISSQLKEKTTQNLLLQQKHPADKSKEQEIRQWLEQFTTDETAVIRWLLQHGEADDHDFRALAMSVSIRGAALNKAIRMGLVKPFPSGTGTAHKITESYRDALREVLYPRTDITLPSIVDGSVGE